MCTENQTNGLAGHSPGKGDKGPGVRARAVSGCTQLSPWEPLVEGHSNNTHRTALGMENLALSLFIKEKRK